MELQRQQQQQQQQQQQSLIPGLPDEIALDCLVRVPYSFHSGLKSVCHRWKSLLSDHFFYHQRKIAGQGEDFVCLVQALADPSGSPACDPAGEKTADVGGGGGSKTPPVYGLTVYNAGHGSWRRLPKSPALLPDGVPMFCQCVAVAGKLVLVGGWDPASLDSVADVYVFDLVRGGGWARGASMSTARSFFACAVVGSSVYVAGGHDNQKNALRSAELYDPVADEWRPLPDMAEERDECHGIAATAADGRVGFWVLSGYGTESQGRFDSSAEFYDPTHGSWARVDGVWPHPNSSPRTASFLPPASARAGRKSEMTEKPSFPSLWYAEAGGGSSGNSQRGLREYDTKERSWKHVGPISELIRSTACVAVLEGPGRRSDRVFMVGSGYSDGGDTRHMAYVMDAAKKKWDPVETPSGFSGFVFSACAVHL